MKSDNERENCIRIRRLVYLVRTQAGFRKALKDVRENELCGEKTDDEGYPRAYPSLVVFSGGYRGYHYITCECFHLNFLRKILDEHDNR